MNPKRDARSTAAAVLVHAAAIALVFWVVGDACQLLIAPKQRWW